MISELDKKILQKVITADTFLSGTYLSHLCNVSINTVRKEIDIINDFLKSHGCRIETRIAMGYSFVIENQRLARPFIEQLLIDIRRFCYLNLAEQSKTYTIIRRLLSASGYVTIDTLTEELYCSKSTVLRNLDRVKEVLIPFHLELRARRNYGLYLEGREWDRRMALIWQHKIFIHLMEADRQKETQFESMFLIGSAIPDDLRKCVLAALMETNLSISRIDLPKISNMLVLNQTRSANAASEMFTVEQVRLARSLSAYDAAAIILKKLPACFAEDSSELDRLSLTMMLAAYQTWTPEQIGPQDWERLLKEAHEIIRSLTTAYDLSGLFDTQFYDDLACALRALEIRLAFKVPADEERIAPSTKMGLFTDDLCVLFAAYYEQAHGVTLKERDLTQIYYIFNRSIFQNQAFFERKRILVVSRFGRYSAANIAVRIQASSASIIDKIQALEYTDLMRTDLTDWDLLVTDIQQAHCPEGIPALHLQFLRSGKEQDLLAAYTAQLFRKKVLALFKADQLIKGDFQNPRDIFECIADQLGNQAGDRTEFIQDLIQRDQIISFERDKGLVMISTMNIQFDQPVFLCLLSRRTFIWENKRNSVFLFYQHGRGTHQDVQLISFLLKQFLHRSEDYLNSLIELKYEEIIRTFS